MEGWVKIHRKTLNNEIWTSKPSTWYKVWQYILFKVNHQDSCNLKRGQGFFNFKQELRAIGIDITYSIVDHVLRFLKSKEQIITQKTKFGVIITVLNYEQYQHKEEKRNKSEIKAKQEAKQEAKSKDEKTEAENKPIQDEKDGKSETKSETLNEPQAAERRNHIYTRNKEERILILGEDSPETEKKQEEISSVGSILRNGIRVPEKKNGISTSWQEKAFRYADYLKIDLTDPSLKARWLKVFKQAAEGRKAKNLELAVSYLSDYPRPITTEGKIKYFFYLYENGLPVNNKFKSGFVDLKYLLIVFFASVLAFFCVFLTNLGTGSVDSDSSVKKIEKSTAKRPTPGDFTPTPTPTTAPAIEKIIKAIHTMESSQGKALSGLHIYCRNQGLWNEYGYGSNESFCFKDKDEADETLRRYFTKRLFVDGMTVHQALCYYNTGKALTSCEYASKSGL